MNQPYLSFLLLLGFVAFNAALLIGLSHLLAPHKPTALKDSPYESGMPPLGTAHDRFSVKFYLVAMLFIIFDIETVFLIPWGTIYFGSGGAGSGGAAGSLSMGFLLVEMLVFMLILAVGYVYVWKRGALQWD
jgi:NADH-quinone oxidoreductase subunit A